MVPRPSRSERHTRVPEGWNRGGYLVTITLLLSLLLGMSALVIDVGYIKLASVQAQNAADAGAHAALVQIKEGGSLSQARALAQEVMRLHRVAGAPVEVDPVQDVLFGGWDYSHQTFDPAAPHINAVEVRVRRTHGSPGGPVDLLMGFYNPRAEVVSPVPAIATFRPRESVLAMDLDGSSQGDVTRAAEATVAMLDELVAMDLPGDRIGMVRLADDPWNVEDVEHGALGTPLQVVRDGRADLRTRWAKGGDRVGVDAAIKVLGSSEDRYAAKVMVLVSDGLSPCRGGPACGLEARSARLEDLAAFAASKSISIYPVSLNRERSQVQGDLLASLSTGTGTFYETDEVAELPAILEEIAHQVPISLVR